MPKRAAKKSAKPAKRSKATKPRARATRGGSFNSFMNNLSSGIVHGFTLGLL